MGRRRRYLRGGPDLFFPPCCTTFYHYRAAHHRVCIGLLPSRISKGRVRSQSRYDRTSRTAKGGGGGRGERAVGGPKDDWAVIETRTCKIRHDRFPIQKTCTYLLSRIKSVPLLSIVRSTVHQNSFQRGGSRVVFPSSQAGLIAPRAIYITPHDIKKKINATHSLTHSNNHRRTNNLNRCDGTTTPQLEKKKGQTCSNASNVTDSRDPPHAQRTPLTHAQTSTFTHRVKPSPSPLRS